MDFFHPQDQQKCTPKLQNNSSSKKRLTQDQVRLLERSFTTNKKLQPELKQQLASQLGVPPRQVAIWYQNKRARWRTQSLELDYNTLQVKLETALVDRRRLEKEVMQLQEELRRTREMLFALNNHGAAPPPLPVPNMSCNSSCDEGGSSSLQEEVNGDQALPFDELYACLIGAEISTWD
ncbi:hypothetical protein Tsubulata_000989 [Turnera subulata]|uniref:Homeobox-leucine zipper protein n=1 Tax=Turnera subulata TaxID=218843 RepID=A0A9Q0FD59_9ROSI|nr:hypothetical protein Tsubulata_000989 [Turnera subulata]